MSLAVADLLEVKPFLCFIKHYAVKLYGAVELRIHTVVTVALDRDKWITHPPDCL